MKNSNNIIYPTEVSPEISRFDKFAATTSRYVSKSIFFAFCVLMVIIWFPSYYLFQDVDSWQLIINTSTTICTFLLLALLQNTQTRDTNAQHHKMNAIADALANLIDAYQTQLPDYEDLLAIKLQKDVKELRAAVGLEYKESS